MNIRFAAPGGAAGIDEPGSEGVLWWVTMTTPRAAGAKADLLDRCHASHTCPKVFDLFGSSEFWGLRHVAGPGRHRRQGRHSAAETVRRY